MYITIDDIKNELFFNDPIDNRNGDKRVGLICAYFIFSFYNVENNERIHFNNGETIKVKKGCYTTKDIEKFLQEKLNMTLELVNQ